MLKEMSRRGRVRERKPFVAFGIVGVLVLLLGGVLWVSYPRHHGAVEEAEASVPVIHADAGPAKVQPDQPGGMDIPSRDSTVFNSLRGQTPDNKKVENLLPQAEQPIDKTKAFAGLKVADAASAAAVEPAAGSPPPGPMMTVPVGAPAQATQPAAQPAPSLAPAAAAPAPAPKTENLTEPAAAPAAAPAADMSAAPAVTPVMTAPVATSEESAPATPSQPAAPAAEEKPVPAAPVKAAAKAGTKHPVKAAKAASSAGGSHYAQLASVRDKKAAAVTWSRLQKQFPELKDQAYRVQEATVTGNTVYRLQAGPLEAGKAKSLCASVTAKKPGACIVVGH